MTDQIIQSVVNTPSAEIASKTFVASTYVPYTGATTNPNIGSNHLIGAGVKANGSGGLLFESNNGTDVLLLGAGGGAGATFYDGVILNTMTQGSIPFFGASGLISQDNSKLFWDNINKRMGINTTTPRFAIDVVGGGLRVSNGSDDSSDFTHIRTDGTLEVRNNNTSPELPMLALYGPYGNMFFYGSHFTTPNINLATAENLFVVRGGGNLSVGAYPGGNPVSKLMVNGNATVGAAYKLTAAPTNGLLVEGNTGIGTDTPTAKLDVNSDIIRLRTAKTPASATATGNAGDICWDADYIYVCVATDTWKRAELLTW
jgi:hypothetical protein